MLKLWERGRSSKRLAWLFPLIAGLYDSKLASGQKNAGDYPGISILLEMKGINQSLQVARRIRDINSELSYA